MPARLHHERVARDGASSWLVLAHGILGSGANWRSIARKLTERRPEWGVVLVDLRGHGHSERGEPPDTLAACAEDLATLVGELTARSHRVRAIGGHSFGGKVALATRGLHPRGLEQTWILDASPSPRPDRATDQNDTILRLIALMERSPRSWPKREDFVAAVVAAGHAKPLAQWLAMNVVADESGAYTLRLDLDQIRALIADYFAQDLWPVLLDPADGAVEVVVAERSNVLDANDRARLATAPPHVHVHMIPAGHWLHIEAQDAVLALLAAGLAGVG